ncbi:uncharacterized protein LOC117535324 [Gymnodraco acuticeps]|uniref:Uncharacterized protein LOC117535324 n=1 Tax=Gymnodraco acuticeps TaxID=8218 RepID=A0A6P8SXK7_GYMAC|nr:uncharacterized protein LOC117535324 [Gymnodraco acuticeps]
MMAGVIRILTFICVAGYHQSSAGPVLHPALVVQAGQNVSLTCNMTSCAEFTWYVVRSNQLLPLLTVTESKLKEITVYFNVAVSRFGTSGEMESGTLTLHILQAEEQDAGLYFFSGRCFGATHVNRGMHLVVDGVDGLSAGQPCWSVWMWVLPAGLILGCILIAGLCWCTGKPAVRCCCPTSQKVTEEVSMHYSSLKHADKPRPTGQGGSGLAEENVIYSAVFSRKNLNR